MTTGSMLFPVRMTEGRVIRCFYMIAVASSGCTPLANLTEKGLVYVHTQYMVYRWGAYQPKETSLA
jgi:hypothetical protein